MARERAVDLSLCVAGATGWTGSAVARGALERPGFRLASAISRSHAGRDLGEAWGEPPVGVPVVARVEDALDSVDVLIDYTSQDAVYYHVMTAIRHGVAVVVGSSGLSSADYDRIDEVARAAGVGVVAAGNFSITAALLQAAALLAARHLPSWEIVDYAAAGKPDAPSGTAREIAERMAAVRSPHREIAVAETGGVAGARGATIADTQVHSVRLPGYTLSAEVIFGLPDETLTLRHDAGTSAAPYVEGTLLAATRAVRRPGLVRGLDTLLVADD